MTNQQNQRASEIAEILRSLAQDETDVHLAEALTATIREVEEIGAAALRGQTQQVLGRSYISLQDRLDELLNIGKDTHHIVMEVQQHQAESEGSIGALKETIDTSQSMREAAWQRMDEKIEQMDEAYKLLSSEVAQIRTLLEKRPSLDESWKLVDTIKRLEAAVFGSSGGSG